VQVQRHVQLDRLFQHRQECRVVQEVVLDKSVHHRSSKAELRNRALQLRRGGAGITHGQGREAREPVRMRSDGLGEVVVRRPGGRCGMRRFPCLGPRHGVRQHLEVDTRRIHIGDPAGADVLQLVLYACKLRMLPEVCQGFRVL
jgi:hypothetical protein